MSDALPESLYVQYMPDSQSVQVLMQLQSELQKHNSGGRQVAAHELHVTVLHFGFLEETYNQLLNITNSLSKHVYNREVQDFITNVYADLPEHCEMKIQGLDRFGPKGSVIVAVLKADIALVHAYEHTMEQLRTFAKNLGIDALIDIPPQSRALQVPTELTPHISLIKNLHSAIDLQSIAQPFIGKTLRMSVYQQDAA